MNNRRSALFGIIALLLTLVVAPAGPAAATPTLVISTAVGTGVSGYSGDGGPATSATLGGSQGMAFDSAGNLYIADYDKNVVRKVTPAGIISTVAGTGLAGYSGNGGPATSAELDNPSGLVVDASGDLYIADSNNNAVRKVTPGGTISTVAGNGAWGYSGDGGPATSAALDWPTGVAVDASGNLYIADSNNNAVRKVTPAGIISTVAGIGGWWTSGYSGDGGPATSAALDWPTGVAVDAAGNLYIADAMNDAVRKVTPGGTISTVAGTGAYGLAFDGAGDLYIADYYNEAVRKMTPAGTISTVAGTGLAGYSGDGGPATSAQLSGPAALAINSSGELYIADYFNSVIRKVALIDVASTTVGVSVDSAMTFTVSAHSGDCNGVAQSSGISVGASFVTLGHVNSAARAVGAQDLRVVSNAAGGFTVYARSTGPMSDGNGNSIAAVSGTNAAPGAFPSAGTAGFGYTTDEANLSGTSDRFTSGGAQWAALDTSPAEVSRAVVPTDHTICLAFQIGVGPSTPAGAYAAVVVYTAVPTF